MPALLSRRRPLPQPNPQADPRFRKVMDELKRGSARVKAHAPAAAKAAQAAAAAKGPPNEKLATGKAEQVSKIEEAPTKKPEKQSFLAILRAEIDKQMPKTLGDTENFMKGGNSAQMKGSLKGNVSQQKEQAQHGVQSASAEAPKETGAAKVSTPIPPEGAPPAPPANGAEGMPQPKSDADVSLQDSKQDMDAQMKEAEVTPEQCKKANDPRFSAVLTAKGTAEKQADTAPGQFRTDEKGVLSNAAAKATADSRKNSAAMQNTRRHSNAAVLSKQAIAKAKDEAERKAVTDHIESIYNRTKQKVEEKLASLDTEVGAMFDAGVDAALAAMTEYVETRIHDYKVDRYLNRLGGSLLWIRDQFKGLPDEVNVFYESGRALFTRLMDAVVVRVANLVETRLGEAKAEVAKGQSEIKTYVDGLPKKLQGVGQSAQKDVAGRFAELETSIEEKKNSLAQQLAQKYKEAFDKANEALKKIQDSNKGLVQAFVEKLAEIIKILTEFKDKLMAVLKKGWDTIKLILADPIGFLGNLISAIKLGISQFVSNIWAHLKRGFMTWLFGSLAEAGIEIPADLSLPSILKLVLGVLGITYERMRAKAVKLIGERAVKVLEKAFEYIKALITGGVAALWEKVKEDLSNLKEMVIDAIQSWLIETIVKQAVMKLVSMFNPAGAIVQAIIAIYNTVMFLIEKASQIMALIEAVVNSVSAIANGAIAGAANWIEQALARAIPVVIGFLARLIGLGGISDKIRDFIHKVQGAVDKAIDKAIAKVVAFVKKLFGSGGKKDDARTEEQKTADLNKGVAEAEALLADPDTSADEVKAKLPAIQSKYKMTKLALVTDSKTDSDETDHIEGEINPKKSSKSKKKVNPDTEYEVGGHVVDRPATLKKGGGESHHVPYKVLKRWIGEIMILAGTALIKVGNEQRGKTLKSDGTGFKNDTVGEGLSAVWLSRKSHVAAHAPTKPGSLSVEGDFVVTTAAGEVSSKPTRATLARTVQQSLPETKDSKAETKKTRNRQIFEAKAKRLPSLFASVFESAVNAGVALVERVKLKDDKVGAKLRRKAKATWKKILG